MAKGIDFKKLEKMELTMKLNKKTRAFISDWWDDLGLERQYYLTIEGKDLIIDNGIRHPNSLTSREIELLYYAKLNK